MAAQHDLVLLEVATERDRQLELGYSHDHDDEHTYAGLLGVVEDLLDGELFELEQTEQRRRMVQAAAVLVAAVETLDRHAVAVVNGRRFFSSE